MPSRPDAAASYTADRPRSPTRALAELVTEAALQPIVEAYTGEVVGYEALIRGFDQLGYASPIDLLDDMHRAGSLMDFETAVHRRAIGHVRHASRDARSLVFLNLDGRLLADPEAMVDGLLANLAAWNYPANLACIELSERTDNMRSAGFATFVARAKRAGIRIAIDDFGTGFSELAVLCDHPVDFVKIDRHFIKDVARSARHRTFLEKVVVLSHALGTRVVAEGVETEADYLACREAGCDLIQGYFVARPTTDPRELLTAYPAVAEVRNRNRRARKVDEQLVRNEMVLLPPIRTTVPLDIVLARFAENPDVPLFPVVDDADYPVGIVHERDLKRYVYSEFGRDLLRNRSINRQLVDLVRPAPVADLLGSTETMVDIFSAFDAAEALILTEHGRYCGVLTSGSLLKVINDKKVRHAHDLNPLTELPGNAAIRDFITGSVSAGGKTRILCYFDFNHFKPFNDAYGFTVGDKAILLFARLMREHLFGACRFVGHIGGDDFFAGFLDEPAAEVRAVIEHLLDAFAEDVKRLYAPEDLAAGCLSGTDRSGTASCFPLMRCSAAVVELGPDFVDLEGDRMGTELAGVKSRAKKVDGQIAWQILTG